jgi:hypothetical protein
MKTERFTVLTVVVGVAALLLAVSFAPPASANTLTLVSPAPVNQQYQQTLNSPCIYGDPSCKQPAGFGETSIAAGGNCCTTFGGTTPGLVTNPTYTVAQIEAAIGGNTFIVGIDVNQTGTSSASNDPYLVYFDMFVNGVLVDHFGTCCGATGGSALQYPNNGNGFADNLLTGFTSLSGFSSSAVVTFHLNYYGADDGTEEFFLINTSNPPPVAPEPGTLLMFGSGLIGIAGLVRRRFAK